MNETEYISSPYGDTSQVETQSRDSVADKESEFRASQEELRKNKIIEEWTSWRNHPYTNRLIIHLLDVRDQHLTFAEDKAVSPNPDRLAEILSESRIIKTIIDNYIKVPLVKQTDTYNKHNIK